MKTMIPLRMMAIGSNIAAIIYGVLVGPSRGDLNIDWLKPFMKSVSHRAGDVLFEKGAHADRLFYVIAGDIRLEEIGKRIGPGSLLGEIGFFTPDQKRTQTAKCATAVELLWIDHSELAQLCYQNPGLAFHLLRLITARLIENAAGAAEAATWRQAS